MPKRAERKDSGRAQHKQQHKPTQEASSEQHQNKHQHKPQHQERQQQGSGRQSQSISVKAPVPVPPETTNNNVALTQPQIPKTEKPPKESISQVLKYLDDYRSPADTKALKEEGYEIDYDRLVDVGYNSSVFLAHSVNAPSPPLDKNGQKPIYTPGYDIAVKVVAKKWVSNKRPAKTRTGNLKLALALGQTKSENNILKVIDVFKTPERIFIFMQYCSYGNVISFIRRNGQVPPKLTQRWSSQMCVALAFLHKFNIAHRNYKLENVLIDENFNAKLTGFGLSKFVINLQTKEPIMSKTICGSGPYLSPEMLTEHNERCYDPKQSDTWAFGVGVFLCVTRRYPFEAENLRALKQEQLQIKWSQRDTKKRLTPPVRELLTSTFTLDPLHRPSMQDLVNHCAWLSPSAPNNSGPAQVQPIQPQQLQQQQPQQQQQQQQQRPGSPIADPPSITSNSARQLGEESNGAEDERIANLNPVVPVAYSNNVPLENQDKMFKREDIE